MPHKVQSVEASANGIFGGVGFYNPIVRPTNEILLFIPGLKVTCCSSNLLRAECGHSYGHWLSWGYRGGSPTAVQAWQPCPLCKGAIS